MINPRQSLVLLVEDEMLIALDLEEIISGLGFRLAPTANSYESSLETARRERPDIALIDGNLADGPTGRRIAEKLSGSGTVCIAVTANPELFEGCGCIDQFLSKPVDERTLKSALARAEALARRTEPRDPPLGPDGGAGE